MVTFRKEHPGWSGTRIRHGTPTGYQLHRHLGEEPCAACFMARKKEEESYRNIPQVQRLHRLRAKAQNRARSRVIKENADLYRKYYLEEIDKLKELGEWPK